VFRPVTDQDALRRLFAGLVERAMYVDLGLCEPGIAQYLTDLMMAFNHMDRIFALRRVSGERIQEVAEMIAEAELGPDAGEPITRRVVHKHVGDFTLFWLGVFPEGVHRLHGRSADAHLAGYVKQGKRSYALASDLSTEKDDPTPPLLLRLSEHFEQCAHGLGLVRRGLEQLSPAGFIAAHPAWRD
jgi:hypothetical protein